MTFLGASFVVWVVRDVVLCWPVDVVALDGLDWMERRVCRL